MATGLNIKETAKLLGVCADTVRKRVRSGEIQATKEIGPYGEMYVIDPDQFDIATEIRDVVPVTKQVAIPELVKAIRTEIMAEVKDELQVIKDTQVRMETLMKERDAKLLEAIRERQQQQKPWYKRIF